MKPGWFVLYCDWNLIAAEQASESESNVCAENLAYVI